MTIRYLSAGAFEGAGACRGMWQRDLETVSAQALDLRA